MTQPLTGQPAVPGWYRFSGGANVMIFLLSEGGTWWVCFDSGEMSRCDWGYIEQALHVWKLVLMAPLGGEGE